MKTNQNMIRKMGEYDVTQRTKDGYFDGNYLLDQWNKTHKKRRRLDDFLSSKSTTEFIDILNDKITIGENSPLAVKLIKGRNTAKGKTKDQIWMHPYLFLDFAMWINPKFKYDVIKFVYDQLIESRHLSGDNYRLLTSAAAKLDGIDFAQLAKALNWIVFGKHSKGLRQIANQEQLKELAEIQKQLAFSIDMGMIKNFDHLIEIMKKMYRQKHNDKISA